MPPPISATPMPPIPATPAPLIPANPAPLIPATQAPLILATSLLLLLVHRVPQNRLKCSALLDHPFVKETNENVKGFHDPVTTVSRVTDATGRGDGNTQ